MIGSAAPPAPRARERRWRKGVLLSCMLGSSLTLAGCDPAAVLLKLGSALTRIGTAIGIIQKTPPPRTWRLPPTLPSLFPIPPRGPSSGGSSGSTPSMGFPSTPIVRSNSSGWATARSRTNPQHVEAESVLQQEVTANGGHYDDGVHARYIQRTGHLSEDARLQASRMICSQIGPGHPGCQLIAATQGLVGGVRDLKGLVSDL